MSIPRKLTEEVKINLLANLRRGKYEQYKGGYKSPYTQTKCYCVLGLLGISIEQLDPVCDLDLEDGCVITNLLQENGELESVYLLDLEGTIKWEDAGVEYCIEPLSELNDAGFTFAQLADVIGYFY